MTPWDKIRERLPQSDRHADQPSFRRAEDAEATSGARVDVRPGHGSASARTARRPTHQPWLARVINQWWTRLLQAVYKGSLSEQEAQYESHSTGRDYVWNTIGTSIWGVVFPILTVVSTQLAGTEEAGMFSMAFVTGTLLMIAANYGVRNYQVSDIDETHSFSSYQINRWLTGITAFVVGLLYCTVRDYDAHMFTICAGVYVYKLVDGIADVYEGRLQQADKLYLAGISQALRSVAAVAAFSLLLFVTRDLAVASVAMAVASVASLVLLTLPLALFETEKSRSWKIDEVIDLFRHCFPLFAALFLFNLIESVPKFVMEGALPYDNQLYFNALYFPAQGILLTIGFVYKPQLLRLASIWSNPRKRRRFDLIIVAVMAVILGLTIVMTLFMKWLGIPLMSFMYGVDFSQFKALAHLMVLAGGVTAAIDFLYAIITVLRRQGAVMKLYALSFGASVVLSLVLVNLLGLAGAVASYLGTMSLLLVLLVVEYARVRREITRERNPFA
ncbi:polysaccharide biosynthesis protein [Collinsella sp. An2]|nr:polysaccharide biosynthesis protein [Collinsella sp. An2]